MTSRCEWGLLTVAMLLWILALAPAISGSGGGAPQEQAPELLDVPESDRPAALAQRVCPVCREMLGSNGTPIKVNVAKQDIFVCSAKCEQALRKDPKAYIKVLQSAKTE
jgi:YHS domain-containing protein